MDYHEQPLGKNVRFLLPSLKLKEPCPGGGTIEQSVHSFLVEHFGGYTATTATVFGYWREDDGRYSYGEHREFTVALPHDRGLPELKSFLSRTARMLRESCLYVEVAGAAVLLYSEPAVDEAPEPDCAAYAGTHNGRNGHEKG
ncbi:MAG TPA: hypothetical protein VM865_05785 [Acidobacteriaceae bacterium]|jgi:hypothetical protein|nr:hypothetical protein [Acidobacteriaceae bacterium]